MKMLPGWKMYEIWSAGYIATGERCPHFYVGEFAGRTFQEACSLFVKANPKWQDGTFKINWFGRVSHWCCGWYDNEKDAFNELGL